MYFNSGGWIYSYYAVDTGNGLGNLRGIADLHYQKYQMVKNQTEPPNEANNHNNPKAVMGFLFL